MSVGRTSFGFFVKKGLTYFVGEFGHAAFCCLWLRDSSLSTPFLYRLTKRQVVYYHRSTAELNAKLRESG